jgi:hypothetical protein
MSLSDQVTVVAGVLCHLSTPHWIGFPLQGRIIPLIQRTPTNHIARFQAIRWSGWSNHAIVSSLRTSKPGGIHNSYNTAGTAKRQDHQRVSESRKGYPSSWMEDTWTITTIINKCVNVGTVISRGPWSPRVREPAEHPSIGSYYERPMASNLNCNTVRNSINPIQEVFHFTKTQVTYAKRRRHIPQKHHCGRKPLVKTPIVICMRILMYA